MSELEKHPDNEATAENVLVRQNSGSSAHSAHAHTGDGYSPPSPTRSVSSLLSSDSTSKLISSLSVNGLKDEGQVRAITKKYEEYGYVEKFDKDVAKGASGNGGSGGSVAAHGNIVVSPVLPKPAPKPVPEALSKKPIKFTVRKVSRDDEGPARQEPRKEYLYGNVPEHRARLEQRKASDKLVLQQSQQKYDLYVVRLEKIEKEIRFLANLLPPYNVEIDYATRSKITRAIEKLRMKKDEIDKKKYLLGISISRMWREYDENSTWVRTVSNQ